jgi:hypothetical protein
MNASWNYPRAWPLLSGAKQVIIYFCDHAGCHVAMQGSGGLWVVSVSAHGENSFFTHPAKYLRSLP